MGDQLKVDRFTTLTRLDWMMMRQPARINTECRFRWVGPLNPNS